MTTVVPTTTSYSYPQLPIPAKTISAPASAFTVANNGYISPYPTTRTYTLNLDYAAGSPGGFLRNMMVINGQFPGPVIEANQGDTLVITVNNYLDHPQSIHWRESKHGR